MARLTGKGFNLFYVAAGESFDDWLRLSEKYKFKLIVQLDFAYMTKPTHEEITRKAPAAIKFIKAHKDHPNILAFSVREEPSISDMKALDEYFGLIKAAVPDAPLHLLMHRRDTLTYALQQVPLVSGTDRYAFWGWDASAGGYAATPFSALNWFKNDMDAYAQYARRANSHFEAVFSTAVTVGVASAEEVRDGSFGDYERILRLARNNNQGWTTLGQDRFRYIKYYRPPQNCTSAMVWLSVYNGAKSLLHWSGNPTDAIQQDIILKELYRANDSSLAANSQDVATDLARGTFTMQIFGSDNRGTYMLDEFSMAVRELQPYGWIINRMEPSPADNDLSVSDERAAIRAFELPGDRGKVFVLVNYDVGSWGASSVRSLVGRDDDFSIDAQGNVVGYRALTQPRSINLKSTLAKQVFRLADGKPIDEGNHIEVRPGGGDLLFIGDPAELAAIRQLSGLAGPAIPNPPTLLPLPAN